MKGGKEIRMEQDDGDDPDTLHVQSHSRITQGVEANELVVPLIWRFKWEWQQLSMLKVFGSILKEVLPKLRVRLLKKNDPSENNTLRNI